MASNWIQVQGQGHCSPFTTKKKNHHRTRRTQQVATSLQQVKPQKKKKKKVGTEVTTEIPVGPLNAGPIRSPTVFTERVGPARTCRYQGLERWSIMDSVLTYGVGFCSLLCER